MLDTQNPQDQVSMRIQLGTFARYALAMITADIAKKRLTKAEYFLLPDLATDN